MSSGTDRYALAAGGVIIALGGLLLADQVGALELDLPWVGAALAAAVGLVLLVGGLTARPPTAAAIAPPSTATPVGDGRLRRDPANGMVAGVIAGIADRIKLDVGLVRIGFAALVVVSGGVALLFYALAWAALPVAGAQVAAPVRRLGRGLVHPGWRVAAGAGMLALAGLLVFRALGLWWSDAVVWPLVLAVAGAAVLWRQQRGTAEAEPAAGPRVPAAEAAVSAETEPGPSGRSELAKLYGGGFGVALVAGAALLFLSANDALGATRDAALTAVVVIVALGLVLAPFLWRLGRNLAAERAARIRTEERAELAAHLHDSVLQTLTLMQKRADDPREVAALARRQERELRSWLFDGNRSADDSFAAALRTAAEEVEDAQGVPIEVVAVGDAELSSQAAAMVAAAREALTNAAKFAPDAGAVRLYAEADADRLQVFVRDRGPGFDPDQLPGDRQGVRESIIGRMERNGGRARIRSGAGEGTEVELTLEREGV